MTHELHEKNNNSPQYILKLKEDSCMYAAKIMQLTMRLKHH